MDGLCCDVLLLWDVWLLSYFTRVVLLMFGFYCYFIYQFICFFKSFLYFFSIIYSSHYIFVRASGLSINITNSINLFIYSFIQSLLSIFPDVYQDFLYSFSYLLIPPYFLTYIKTFHIYSLIHSFLHLSLRTPSLSITKYLTTNTQSH